MLTAHLAMRKHHDQRQATFLECMARLPEIRWKQANNQANVNRNIQLYIELKVIK